MVITIIVIVMKTHGLLFCLLCFPSWPHLKETKKKEHHDAEEWVGVFRFITGCESLTAHSSLPPPSPTVRPLPVALYLLAPASTKPHALCSPLSSDFSSLLSPGCSVFFLLLHFALRSVLSSPLVALCPCSSLSGSLLAAISGSALLFRLSSPRVSVTVAPTDAALRLAGYLTTRRLPDKAIDLIDEAASRLRLQQESKPEPIQDIDRQVVTLTIEETALKKESDARSQQRVLSQLRTRTLKSHLESVDREPCMLTFETLNLAPQSSPSSCCGGCDAG